jgi:hypothetical protein
LEVLNVRAKARNEFPWTPGNVQMSYTRGYIREALIRYRFVTVELRSRCMLAMQMVEWRSWNDNLGWTREDAGTESIALQQAFFTSREKKRGF